MGDKEATYSQFRTSGHPFDASHEATREQPSRIKILIVDDHAIVRAGLKQFIANEPDMVVEGEADSGGQALSMIRDGHWDIVILDVSMPDQNGVDTLRRIKSLEPQLPVLILSGFSENQYAVNLLRAGASGYLSKDGDSRDLITAIRMVVQGGKYVTPALTEILVNDLAARQEERPPHSLLSEREFQVFCHLAAAIGVSKIAQKLGLSVKTVSTYRTRALEKMKLTSNAELTQYAVRHRLID
ncbi:MAG TPA: response regulator transcription factor [Burkholderiales bacterium]|nr:response regulator transcription factor [Burkholderiales bacterium]